jgi:hypothetical protein
MSDFGFLDVWQKFSKIWRNLDFVKKVKFPGNQHQTSGLAVPTIKNISL